MEVSHFLVMSKFSALRPMLHWEPVQARGARGSIYAQTDRLLLAYLLVPEGGLEVNGSSWKETKERGGRTDGRMNMWHIPWVPKHLVAALTWGQSVRRELFREAFLWYAQRQEQTMPATVHSAPSLLKFSPWCPSQGRPHRSLTAPFPREAGSVPSACCCLQPTGRLTLLSLPLLPACLTSSSARPVFGLFSLFKYRQDVYLVVVLEQFLKIFPVLCFVFPS